MRPGPGAARTSATRSEFTSPKTASISSVWSGNRFRYVAGLGVWFLYVPAVLQGHSVVAGLAVVVVAALAGAPIFAILGGTAALMFMHDGDTPATILIHTYSLSTSPTLAAIPLFTLAGFRTFVRDDLRITIGFTARVDATMRVGQLQETVTVSGAAPVVDLTSSGTAANFTTETLTAVPRSRDLWMVVDMAPGVARPGAPVVIQVWGDPAGCDLEAMKAVASQSKRIDHLVYAVGVGSGKFGFPFWNLEPADWPRVLQVNVVGAVNVAHAFSPYLIQARAGSLLFLASVAGQIGSQTDPPYSASKAALINFAQCAAKDLAPYGVRVNSICPGMVKTALNESIWAAWNRQQPEDKRRSYDDWAQDKIRKVVPLGRWQEPQDIAALAVFLASDCGKNITGQTLNVDGGFVMHW